MSEVLIDGSSVLTLRLLTRRGWLFRFTFKSRSSAVRPEAGFFGIMEQGVGILGARGLERLSSRQARVIVVG